MQGLAADMRRHTSEVLAPIDSLTVNLGCIDDLKHALMSPDQIQQQCGSSSLDMSMDRVERDGNIASALTSGSQSLSVISAPMGFHRVQSLINISGDVGARQYPTYDRNLTENTCVSPM